MNRKPQGKSSNVTVRKMDGSSIKLGPIGKPIRQTIANSLRDKVVLRDQGTCRYCGNTPKQIHLDHIVPVVQGGRNDISNLVVACRTCNIKKKDKIWQPLSLERLERMRKKRLGSRNAKESAERKKWQAEMKRRETLYIDNRRTELIGETPKEKPSRSQRLVRKYLPECFDAEGFDAAMAKDA